MWRLVVAMLVPPLQHRRVEHNRKRVGEWVAVTARRVDQQWQQRRQYVILVLVGHFSLFLFLKQLRSSKNGLLYLQKPTFTDDMLRYL